MEIGATGVADTLDKSIRDSNGPYYLTLLYHLNVSVIEMCLCGDGSELADRDGDVKCERWGEGGDLEWCSSVNTC